MDRRGAAWTAAGIGTVIAVALLLRALTLGSNIVPFSDSDDAMHMVTAISLADGQSWFDTTSSRENTPFGAPMHFSRLVDAPIAGLLLLLRPLLGGSAADFTALLYPLLLIPLLCLLSTLLVRRLVPTANPLLAAVAPFFAVITFFEFAPGRVDHHNVQMLLTGALALATIAGRTNPGAAVAAGVLAALSLAVGAETFHLIAAAIAVFGLFWVADPQSRRAVTGFAAGLALTSIAIFLCTIAPTDYLVRACDAFSFSYLVAIAAAAVALLLAVALGRVLTTPLWRFLALAGLGLVAGATTLAVSPQCLGGPYAGADPQLMRAFLATVIDAQDAWSNFLARPAETFAIAGIPLLQFALGLLIAWRAKGRARIDWLVLLAFLSMALLVTLVQLRGARLTVLYGVPVTIWLIDAAWRRLKARNSPVAALLVVLSCLPFTGMLLLPLARSLGVGPLVTPPVVNGLANAPGGDWAQCIRHSAFARLAALPPARVMAPVGTAAITLYFTPHSVVGTGFHRNEAGLADNVAFFAGGEATAREVAERRGLDYMVLCGAFEFTPLTGNAADSLNSGARYDWLVPISGPDEPLQVYRIALPPG